MALASPLARGVWGLPAVSSQAAAWTGTETHRDLGYVLVIGCRDSLTTVISGSVRETVTTTKDKGLAQAMLQSVAQMSFLYGVLNIPRG